MITLQIIIEETGDFSIYRNEMNDINILREMRDDNIDNILICGI